MEAKAKLLGHPVHQMLIVLPLGLLVTAIIFDIVHLLGGGLGWAQVSYWIIAAGVIGGLLSAPFGFIDWLGVPSGTRAKRIGAIHGIGNVIVVLLFAISWLLRRPSPTAPAAAAYVFSFVGFAVAGVTAWLGGEMVNRLGIGVYAGANPNSPSSLSGRPAVGETRERMA
ncbi:MAG TPA: DUF2231 domain-containing protein [Gemmatimonadales bacterium]|nr:DUF2231 domain-containing protein [Gemmatimonadales bacterium]